MGNAPSYGHLSEEEQHEVLQGNCTVEEICGQIAEGKIKNVVVMVGAGLSVSAGIPDFRSPGTGLYSQLEEYDLPRPEAVFELDFFHRTQGAAFYKLAKNIWPSEFQPTPGHAFIRLLHEKGLLLRCFTQNIDTLERCAGVPGEKLVEAHGSFAAASCSRCGTSMDIKTCEERILKGGEHVPIMCPTMEDDATDEQEEENTVPRRRRCIGMVKPNIVFFGEDLPERFDKCCKTDFPKADLVIIAGTSLTVEPFASLVHLAPPNTPRLLLNMVPVGIRGPANGHEGLRLRQHDNYRDVMVIGECDNAVRAICDQLGWRKELESIVQSFSASSSETESATNEEGSKDPKESTSCTPSSENEENLFSPIDWSSAFPEMPGGVSYNWKLAKRTEDDLPPLSVPLVNPEKLDIEGLMNQAEASPSSVALAAQQLEGSDFKLILCVDTVNYERFDEDDFLAVVPAGTLDYPYGDDTVQYRYLNQPVVRLPNNIRREGIRLFVLPMALGDPDSPRMKPSDDNELWLISNETGRLVSRWKIVV